MFLNMKIRILNTSSLSFPFSILPFHNLFFPFYFQISFVHLFAVNNNFFVYHRLKKRLVYFYYQHHLIFYVVLGQWY